MNEHAPAAPTPLMHRSGLTWGVLVVVVITIAALHHLSLALLREAPPADRGVSTQILVVGRVAVGLNHWFGPMTGPNDPDIGQQMLSELDGEARRPIDKLHAIMVRGEIEGAAAALTALDRIPEDVAPALSGDIQSLRAIYSDGTEAIDASARDGLAERHGWFGQLAASYGKPATDSQRRAVISAALRPMVTLFVAGLCMLAVTLAGFVLFGIAVVLGATGRLRLAYRPAIDLPNPAFLETLAIFLSLLFGLSLAAKAVDHGIHQTAVVLLVSPWAVLWPRVRGIRWRAMRDGFGWRAGRGVMREAGAGMVGYLAGIPILLVGLIGSILLAHLSGLVPTHPLVDEVHGRPAIDLAMIFVLAVVWAPLVEETVFRGAFYHHLRRQRGVISSSLIVALAFAAVHPQGLVGLPALFAVAVIFAALREWRGSIIAPVCAHACHNLALTTILVLVLR